MGDPAEELRKKTISLLSSVLTAKAKVGIPIHLLCYEYEETVFEKLNIRDMGYGTIQQFISDNSDVFTVSRGYDGHMYIKAVPTEETAHIHRLVSGQKLKTKSKKKSKKIVFPVRRVSIPSRGRPPPSFITNRNVSGFRPVNPAFRSGPIHMKNTLPPRFQQRVNNYPPVRPNPTRSFMNSKPKYPSKSNVTTPFTSNRTTPVTSNKTTPVTSNKTTPPVTLSRTITAVPTDPSISLPLATDISKMERNLKTILQGKPNGIFATRLKPEYSKLFGEELPQNIKQILEEKFSHFIDIQSPLPSQHILYFKESIPVTPNAPLPCPGLTPIVSESQANITQLSSMNISRTPTAAASSTLIESTPSVIPVTNGKVVSPVPSIFQISSLDLPEVGDELNVYVCHIESLARFFIQLQASTIDDLVQEMQDYYNNPSSEENKIITPKVGEYCCARFTQDKLWFRAKTLSVKEQRNVLNASYRCHVFYPDYGNDEYVLSTELKSLTEDFCELPFQAIQCCLYNLVPVEGNTWSEATIDVFRKITEDVELVLKVVENNGNLLSVDLSDAENKSVCQHLIDEGYAKERIPTKPAAQRNSSRQSLSRTLSLEPAGNVVTGSWIKIPDDSEYIDICVTHIVSSRVVYAKMVGADYHEKLEALETAINNNFENASVKPAAQLQIGQYYIVLYDDEWRRAQLTGVTDDDDCEILLVDSGVKSVVIKDEVKNIQQKFLRLPFQAFCCTLKDVPESNDTEILQYMTEALLGKANLGLVYGREESETTAHVVLGIYDEFSDGTEINALLQEKIEAEKKLVPKLPEVGEDAANGFVTDVTEDGEFYVQVFGPGLDRLETLTKDIRSHFSQCSRAAEIIAHPEVGQICCAKCPQSSNWYRAQVKQVFQSQRKVEIEFIDYGNREIINMVLIRKPTAVSESVITLPFQALKVKMFAPDQLLLNEEGMNEKLKDFIYEMGGVRVKMQVTGVEEGVSVVRFTIPTDVGNEIESRCVAFVESFQEFLKDREERERAENGADSDDGDGELASDTINNNVNNDDTINTTFENISLYQTNTTLSEWEVISNGNSPEKAATDAVKQQQQLSDIKEEEQRSSSGCSSTSSASLRSPRSLTPAVTFSQHWGMPELKLSDPFIAGIVQDVTDPGKFTVIPYDQWDLLETMHKEMATFYNNNENHKLRDITSLTMGDICAVYNQHHDIWYRAVIHAIIDDKMVVKFPDFSSTPEFVSCKDIRMLTDQFKQMAFLSIRCSLFGLQPLIGNNWSDEVRDVFSRMVINETFQVEIMSDTNDQTKPVLVTLHGSGNDGKHMIVNNNLVTMGYARRTSN